MNPWKTIGDRRRARIVPSRLAVFPLALAAIAAIPGPPAWAQPPGHWLSDYYPPGTGGSVSSMVVHRDRLFVAGHFDWIGGVEASGIAAWDGVNWSVIPSPVEGLPYDPWRTTFMALASFSGDLVAAGGFDSGDSVHTGNIMRWDGRAWSGLGPGLNYAVSALLVSGGRLVAGGDFTASGGDSCARIAVWDGVRWQPLGRGFTRRVSALANFEGQLIAGGEFDRAGTVYADHIAAWDGVSWQPLGAGVPWAVQALAVFQERLFAGGYFGLRVWDGQEWSEMDGAPDRRVTALQVFGDRLVASGDFDWLGDEYAGGIAAWDGSAWSTFENGFRGGAEALAIYQGELYAGGSFDRAGPLMLRSLVRWDGESWQAVGGHAFSRDALTLASTGSRLVATRGAYSLYGDPPRTFLWEERGGGWHLVAPPAYGQYARIGPVMEYGGRIVMAGNFIQVGDCQVNNFTSWDGVSCDDFGAHLASGASVNALAIDGGDLIIAGGPGQVGDITAERVARWDGTAWHDMSAGIDESVAQLVNAGDLLVARVLHMVGYRSNYEVRWWDGASWQPFEPLVSGAGLTTRSGSMATGAIVVDDVDAAVAHQGGLVIGAMVHDDADSSRAMVLRWSGSGWDSLGVVSGSGAYLRSLASYHGDLVIAGRFDAVSGVPAAGLARREGGTWVAMNGLASGPERDTPDIYSLLALGDTLFVTGWFDWVDGRVADGLAAWTDGMAAADTMAPALTLGVHPDPLGGGTLDIYLTSPEALAPDSTAISLDAAALAISLPEPGIARARARIEPAAAVPHHVAARGMDLAGNAATAALDFTATPLAAARDAVLGSPDGRLSVEVDGNALARSGLGIVAQDAAARDDYVIEPGAGNERAEMILAFRWPDAARPSAVRSGGDTAGAPLLAIQKDGGEWLPSIVDTVAGVVRATARGGGRYRLAPAPPGWSAFAGLAAAFDVGRAAPDPFGAGHPGGASATRIEFALPAAGRVRVRVHDVNGRAVATLVDDMLAGGAHRVAWDGCDAGGRRVAAGLYFVAFDYAGRRAVRKVVVAP